MADKDRETDKAGLPVPTEEAEAEYVEAEPIERPPTFNTFAEYAWHMMSHAPMPIDACHIRKLKKGEKKREGTGDE